MLAARGFFVYFDEVTGRMTIAQRVYRTTRMDASRYLNRNTMRNTIHKRRPKGK
jgi:hypothetical protein